MTMDDILDESDKIITGGFATVGRYAVIVVVLCGGARVCGRASQGRPGSAAFPLPCPPLAGSVLYRAY